MKQGDCIGLPAGTGLAHRLINQSGENMTYLEIGDRHPEDIAGYPYDDIKATWLPDQGWVFTHRDGSPFAENKGPS
ncbi:MAG: hypothetical protein Q9M29_05265 [Mariprofundaceae bacterium]|nr:hypothetical protein [Mariprofundaceae bacterium]